ncbi:hypothetical protein Riv7116_2465 [Rivularia sp. PCC 7116]|nr:hypothetical protein Riv7116_2465 [Rivularia sp. PCC 7116]
MELLQTYSFLIYLFSALLIKSMICPPNPNSGEENHLFNLFFGVADYKYDFAPQPPTLGEKDNLKSPNFG